MASMQVGRSDIGVGVECGMVFDHLVLDDQIGAVIKDRYMNILQCIEPVAPIEQLVFGCSLQHGYWVLLTMLFDVGSEFTQLLFR